MGFAKLSDLLGSTEAAHERVLYLEGYTDSANLYVVTGETLALIDSANDATVFPELEEAGRDPGLVRTVLLTHGHFDHALGVVALLNGYGSLRGSFEVAMHPDGPVMLRRMVGELGGKVRDLTDGEHLAVAGVDLEVLFTPGHTADSLCFYDAASRTLFAGDTLLTDEGALPMPDPTAGGNLADYLASLRRLRSVEVEYVCPGHGPPIRSPGGAFVRQVYVSALESLKGPTRSWKETATALMANGLFEDAVYCCDREIEAGAKGPEPVEIKASCLADLGRNEEAEALYNELLARGEQSYRLWVAKGFNLLHLQRYADSLSCFEAARGLDPAAADAAIGRGMALWLLGRGEEAMDIPEFERAFSGSLRDEIRKYGESRPRHEG